MRPYAMDLKAPAPGWKAYGMPWDYKLMPEGTAFEPGDLGLYADTRGNLVYRRHGIVEPMEGIPVFRRIPLAQRVIPDTGVSYIFDTPMTGAIEHFTEDSHIVYCVEVCCGSARCPMDIVRMYGNLLHADDEGRLPPFASASIRIGLEMGTGEHRFYSLHECPAAQQCLTSATGDPDDRLLSLHVVLQAGGPAVSQPARYFCQALWHWLNMGGKEPDWEAAPQDAVAEYLRQAAEYDCGRSDDCMLCGFKDRKVLDALKEGEQK